MKNRSFPERLGFALNGFGAAMGERSFRTHLAFAVMAGVALLALRPNLVWWGLVGVMVALVLAAELFNTALERLCDHLHPEEHPEIGLVKDLAAAAVLMLSLGALFVAALTAITVLWPAYR